MTKSALYQARRATRVVLAETVADFSLPAGNSLSEIVAVEETCPAGDCYTPEPLDALTLWLTLYGRATLHAGGTVFSHEPGTLTVAASGVTIREQVDKNTIWQTCYLLLWGEWATQMNQYLQRQETPVFALFAPPAMQQLFQRIVTLVFDQPAGWQWAAMACTAELFGGLYHKVQETSDGDALLQMLTRRLEAFPAERLTLTQMEAYANLTPRQLLYQFGKATGEPLAQWVRKRRIAAANRLLGQGQSVTQVAQYLGFANPYHFSRTFKAVTGVAPSLVSERARYVGLSRERGILEQEQ